MMALLRAVSGLILWAIAFSALYGLQGLVCALGLDAVRLVGVSVARLLLVLMYTGWIAILGWLCWHLRPHAHPDYLARLAFTCAIIGLVSTIYTGMPVLTATTCS